MNCWKGHKLQCRAREVCSWHHVSWDLLLWLGEDPNQLQQCSLHTTFHLSQCVLLVVWYFKSKRTIDKPDNCCFSCWLPKNHHRNFPYLPMTSICWRCIRSWFPTKYQLHACLCVFSCLHSRSVQLSRSSFDRRLWSIFPVVGLLAGLNLSDSLQS